MVLSDLNIRMSANVLHFTWNWVPPFNTPSKNVVLDLMKSAKLGIGRPKLKDLKYQMSYTARENWRSLHNIILYGLLGVVTIMVFGISIQGYRNNRTATTGTNTDLRIFKNVLEFLGRDREK